ncbi:hypothetical protein [Sphingopyxis sp. NFH-91]|uniref:hypothetical protein n=1 Tax=Sphingopyxis sp. NFH-91 TaxID=2744457 RepID=UPI001F4549A3|nr:hypothetical protein [Sphingopyxis sp. NFH-91]
MAVVHMLNGRLRKIYDQDFHIDITGAKHVCNRSSGAAPKPRRRCSNLRHRGAFCAEHPGLISGRPVGPGDLIERFKTSSYSKKPSVRL